MLKIRLQRLGRKHLPVYRVVVIDSRKKRQSGSFVKKIGMYDPINKSNTIINQEEADKYIKFGAQPTDRVLKLLKLSRNT